MDGRRAGGFVGGWRAGDWGEGAEGWTKALEQRRRDCGAGHTDHRSRPDHHLVGDLVEQVLGVHALGNQPLCAWGGGTSAHGLVAELSRAAAIEGTGARREQLRPQTPTCDSAAQAAAPRAAAHRTSRRTTGGSCPGCARAAPCGLKKAATREGVRRAWRRGALGQHGGKGCSAAAGAAARPVRACARHHPRPAGLRLQRARQWRPLACPPARAAAVPVRSRPRPAIRLQPH